MISDVRTRTMRAIKSKDTKPELFIRKLIHGLGYRFRLHRKDLPGNPDLVFPSRHKVIFVHGCFWHGHGCKRGARMPKSNLDYWQRKISSNQERDVLHLKKLSELNWEVLTIWECETKDIAIVQNKIEAFLKASNPKKDM